MQANQKLIDRAEALWATVRKAGEKDSRYLRVLPGLESAISELYEIARKQEVK